MERSAVDPVTVEVIRNYFIATANQMRAILVRTSFNPVIYEMKDFAIGMFTDRFELIALDPGSPIFVGALGHVTRAMVTNLREEGLEDGDAILSTFYPDTGAHANDVCVCTPVFVDGEVFAYVTSKAHWMDLGGKDIYTTDSTDIFQEGLIVRSTKVRKAGVDNADLRDVMRLNSRVGDAILGDLGAQLAAAEHGKRMVLALVDKYGKQVVRDAIAEIFDHGERMTREVIRSLPDGSWTAEASLDDDGVVRGVPVPVRLTVTIEGDQLTFDTTGSSRATMGPVNAPYIATYAGLTYLSLVLLTPDYSANEGCYRPLKVVAEEGSVFNALPPSPVCLYGWSVMCAIELGFMALADAVPDRVVARSGGDLNGFLFFSTNPDGSVVAGAMTVGEGMGAWIDSDGTSALVHLAVGSQADIPAEIIEARFPFLVQHHRLRQDSGGPGRFRGGLGVEKRLLATNDMRLVVAQDQHSTAAWGLHGGHPSPFAGDTVLRAGTDHEVRVGKVTGFMLPKGEVMEVLSGGGGGWGDPLERDEDRVLADVVAGYVSPEQALHGYGVAITLADGVPAIDREASAGG